MLKTADIEMKLLQCESGIFQKVCNEILCQKGYKPYNYTGSLKGTNKTKLGTPDSVFIDSNGKYVYIEITTQKDKLDSKIKQDVEKCLNKIKFNPILKDKVSKIIYIHNNDNPDESITDSIKKMCGNVEFEIYGIFCLSSILQKECNEIAISLLDLKEDIQTVCCFSNEALDQLANFIKKEETTGYKENTIEEIKNKINDLYEEASLIINNEDAMICISLKNRERLKYIHNNLNVFDFYYRNKEDDESKVYYHNLLVILSKANSIDGMNFYNTMPSFVKDNNATLSFYSMILIENKRYDEAIIILKDLYFNKKYQDSFQSLVKLYFMMEDYNSVIKLLNGIKIEKFDKYGFMSAMLIISKNNKRKYTEGELIKLNNSKFKGMPIFHSCIARMLYNLDNKKKKYQDQFKKALKLLKEKDIVAINLICDEAIGMKIEGEAISFLESINLSPILQNRLLELLCRQKSLTQKQIKYIESIDLDNIDENIDINYLKGKVSESRGKELEAINNYKKSYEQSNNIIAGFNYIQLSIKNKSKIDENAIQVFAKQNTIDSLMVVVNAYNYMGKYDKALQFSYKLLYIGSKGNKKQICLKQFWYNNTLNIEKKLDEIDLITKDSVIILKT